MNAITTPVTDPILELAAAVHWYAWTHTSPEPTQLSGHRVERHTFTSPGKDLYLHASRQPSGEVSAYLAAPRRHTAQQRQPGWQAEVAHLPAHVTRAAIAACTAPHPEIANVLADAGWHLAEEVSERGRLLERRWESNCRTRSLSWFPADQFDDGGWTIHRPLPAGPETDLHASRFTPHAVLAALALTD